MSVCFVVMSVLCVLVCHICMMFEKESCCKMFTYLQDQRHS